MAPWERHSASAALPNLAVEAGAHHREPDVLRSHDGLGPAEEQHAAGAKRADKTVENPFLGVLGEVDDHVAASDQIERTHRIRIAKQVVFRKADAYPRRGRHADLSVGRADEPAAGTVGADVTQVRGLVARARSGVIEDSLVDSRSHDRGGALMPQ